MGPDKAGGAISSPCTQQSGDINIANDSEFLGASLGDCIRKREQPDKG